MRAIHIDVVRTDRTFGFYATAGDSNVNIQTLYNILVTYCISHPSIPYCQGFYLLKFSSVYPIHMNLFFLFVFKE